MWLLRACCFVPGGKYHVDGLPMAATGWECGVEALELGVCSWRSSSIDGQFRKKDWKGRLELCQGVVNILP